MAVGAASKEVARHDHTGHPRTASTCTMCARRDRNLTSKLAKLGLRVGGTGGADLAAGPDHRDTDRGQGSERNHCCGWLSGERRERERSGECGGVGGGGGGGTSRGSGGGGS